MTLAEWKELATIFSAVSPILVIVAVAVMSRYFPTHEQVDKRCSELALRVKATEERLQAQSERLNSGDSRFLLIEQRLDALPTAEAITDLRVSIERLSADIRVAAERHEGLEDLLKATRNQLTVIDDHLRSIHK